MSSVLPPDASGQELWSTASVPLTSIETELEKLWHKAARAARRAARSAVAGADGGAEEPATPGLSRARVLNFVAYAALNPATGDGDGLVEAIGAMAAKHSFRTIMILADEGAGDAAIDATISARALEGADGRRLFTNRCGSTRAGPFQTPCRASCCPCWCRTCRPTFGGPATRRPGTPSGGEW